MATGLCCWEGAIFLAGVLSLVTGLTCALDQASAAGKAR